MARDGRYVQQPKKRTKFIWAIPFLLIFLAGLFFFYTGTNKGEADTARFTEPEITEQVHTTQQTLATEEILLVPVQTRETTVNTDSTEIETVLTEATETEAVTESFQETEGKSIAVSEETIDAYEPVLQQYRELIMMDSDEFLKLYGNESELDLELSLDALQSLVDQGEIESIVEILERPTLSKRYPFVDAGTLYYSKMYGDNEDSDRTGYHYAYYNIDNARSYELLIGQYDDYHDAYTILAMYTLSNDEPRLLQSIVDNSRSHLTIYTDGTFGLDSSGGASTNSWQYYRMDETFDMDEKVASFYINYDSSKREYMASVVEGYENMLTPVDDIIWYPLIEE